MNASVPAGTLLGTFQIQETGGSAALPAGSYINGFAAFPIAAVPSGSKVEIRNADGSAVLAAQQFDSRRLHTDGSLRCVAWKFKTEGALSAGASVSYKIYSASGAFSNNGALNITQITGASDFILEAEVGGTTYTCSLNDNTAGAVKHSDGAVCVEYVVRGEMENAGTPHASLWARFYVRLYEDGTTFRVKAHLINDYVENAASITVTSSAFKDGSTTIKSRGSEVISPQGIIAYGHGTDDSKPYWSANEPLFHVKYDMDELQDAGLIFKMNSSAGLITAIGSAVSNSYDPDGDGIFSGTTQDGTGGNSWIGLIMADDAKALITQDKDWHKRAIINHMGSYRAAIHFYERTGFYLPVVNNHHASYSLGPDRKSVGASAGATLTITGAPATYSKNASHYPAWGYYPYITTGDRWWLDEMQAHAVGLLLCLNPGTFNENLANTFVRNAVTMNGHTYYGWGGAAQTNNIRGAAWMCKMLGNAAFLTPDADESYDYFDDIITEYWAAQADWVSLNITDNADREALGWVRYSSAGTIRSPWMSDYYALVTALALKRGQVSASNLIVTHHIEKFCIGRFNNGCPYNAPVYRMTEEQNNTTDSSNSLCTAWSQVYRGEDSAAARELLIPGGGCPASGINSDMSQGGGHTYPAIAHAMAEALNHVSIGGADDIAAYLEANNTTTDAQWANNPQWYIRP